MGSSEEEVRGSRTAREGCRGMQGGTACCHLGSFSTPTRKLLPRLCLAQTLAQDTPLEAMEFGKNLWQYSSRPQLHFWLAKFIADKGRNTVLSKTPQGKPLPGRAQQKGLQQGKFHFHFGVWNREHPWRSLKSLKPTQSVCATGCGSDRQGQ